MSGHQHSRRRGGGGHHYICAGSDRKGKAQCDGNTISRRELLDTVVDAVVDWASDPAVVDDFHRRARRMIQEEIPEADPVTIRAQLTSIDAKVSKAENRLVEVDTDMLPLVQEQLRAMLTERERLEAALKAATTSMDAILCEAPLALAGQRRQDQV